MQDRERYVSEDVTIEVLKTMIHESYCQREKEEKRRFIKSLICIFMIFLIIFLYIYEYWQKPPIGNYASENSVQQIGDNNNNNKGDE